jgi:hypothetical protein
MVRITDTPLYLSRARVIGNYFPATIFNHSEWISWVTSELLAKLTKNLVSLL